jgi:hypothetical protein
MVTSVAHRCRSNEIGVQPGGVRDNDRGGFNLFGNPVGSGPGGTHGSHTTIANSATLKEKTLKIIRLGGIALSILAGALCVHAQSNRSVYTNLGEKSCKTIKSDSSEAGSYVGLCPGVGGYKLQVEEGDLRQNIQVITPKGEKNSLELWNVVGSSFSSLGEKAEWRVKTLKGKVVPVALIVRYNVSNPEDSTRKTSYLAVTKITNDKICVTDKIGPGADANVSARAAADQSSTKPCLPSQ